MVVADSEGSIAENCEICSKILPSNNPEIITIED